MADDDYSDQLAELIGGPGEGDPTDPIDALLAAPDEEKRWVLRRIAERDPVAAFRAVLPEYSEKERLHFAQEYRREQRRRRARRILEEEEKQQTAIERPKGASLTDLLAQPDEDVHFLIDRLWPAQGKVVLAAQNKAGKTTLVGNLVRSLVDGDAFLGQFKVEQVDRVVLLDNELSPGMVRRWLRDQGIVNTDAVDVFAMRGRLSSFDILDPATRAEWADHIGPADVLLFDPLRPALDALGLSEDKDSGRFLEALDELVAAAGIGHLGVVHHMGHSNERSRGDSRIEDWPDAKWRLVRDRSDPDDPDGNNAPRFFSAFGRDVDQPETRLDYSPEDRHLSVLGGSRRTVSQDRVATSIRAYVAGAEGCSGGEIERGVGGDTRLVRAAIKSLAEEGWLRLERQGPGKATKHYSATPAERDFDPVADETP